MSKVAICTPHREKAFSVYYQAIREMEARWKKHKFIILDADGIVISVGRNMLVNMARDIGADVIWFIDDDVIIPPEAGVLVEQAMKKQVVSGVYFGHSAPFLPEVFRLVNTKGIVEYYDPVTEYPQKGLRQEDATAGGCICIRIDVFEKLEKNWYPYLARILNDIPIKYKNESIIKTLKDLSPWYEILNQMTDDIYFCERLKEIHIPIWVNWGIKCSHIGYRYVNEENFRNVMEYLKKDKPPNN
jgi:hypothetical protein